MNEADRVFEFAERRFNAPAPGVELPQRRKRELCGVQVGHQHLRFAVFSASNVQFSPKTNRNQRFPCQESQMVCCLGAGNSAPGPGCRAAGAASASVVPASCAPAGRTQGCRAVLCHKHFFGRDPGCGSNTFSRAFPDRQSCCTPHNCDPPARSRGR